MNYIVNDSDLTSVAQAIRTKGGTAANLTFPSGFNSAIAAIPSGGGGDELFKKTVERTITSITSWPTGITQIGMYAFFNCMSLTTVSNFPSTITWIDSRAFQQTGLVTVDMSGLTNLTVDWSTYCFYACSNLKTVILPPNVTLIPSNTFYGCSSLESITIPNSVTLIGSAAFQSCASLTTLTIPSAVTLIGASAFKLCTGLTKLRFNSTTPPTVALSNAFLGLPTTCVISVPTGTLSAYTSASYYPSSATYTYIEE